MEAVDGRRGSGSPHPPLPPPMSPRELRSSYTTIVATTDDACIGLTPWMGSGFKMCCYRPRIKSLSLSVCVCARALNPCSKQSLYNNMCYACCGDGTQSSHQQRILVDAGHDLLQLVPFCRFDLEELGRQEVLLGVVVRLVDCLL